MNLVRIDRRYRLRRRLGFGSSGEIYMAHDIFSGQDIAVKLKPMQGSCCTLEHEFNIYEKLAGGLGILFVHSFRIECGYNVMVMKRLGPSLEQLFSDCHFRFSTRTILLLASQLNFIYRDLKPSNIIMGVRKHTDIVYIIDFGLLKEFRHPDTYLHIPYTRAQGLIGMATFTSTHSHLGFELESKLTTSAHDLCQGLPVQLGTFLEYSRSLSFDGKPDYDYLYNLFQAPLLWEGFRSDMTFDWNDSDNGA
ncbi:casein kinase I delta [Russula ochroleuca]|uniref:non-specific serine/threonine protein kinase n=1 Tax=Russula ochroleuca TaxID=152965 RepID=A0A9P5MTG4_9AGAM|nr:casein kinase I delta [Russula ochroleuca]